MLTKTQLIDSRIDLARGNEALLDLLDFEGKTSTIQEQIMFRVGWSIAQSILHVAMCLEHFIPEDK